MNGNTPYFIIHHSSFLLSYGTDAKEIARMLILTRKCEQSIIINDDIVVMVLAVEGDRVKLGIRAPREVTVLREEVRREVGGENRRAAATPVSRTAMEAALRKMNGLRTEE